MVVKLEGAPAPAPPLEQPTAVNFDAGSSNMIIPKLIKLILDDIESTILFYTLKGRKIHFAPSEFVKFLPICQFSHIDSLPSSLPFCSLPFLLLSSSRFFYSLKHTPHRS